MFDPTKPVQTRDGKRSVEILKHDIKGTSYPICAVLTMPNGDQSLDVFAIDGCISIHKSDSPNDLINIPVKHVRYINIYESFTTNYDSRKEADRGKSINRIACIRIEYEEGQFDD